MPITQDRLKLLTDAARDVATAYFTLCATLAEQVSQHRAGKLSLLDLLEWCEMRNVRPDAAIASELLIIQKEEIRWQFSHTKNEQEQRRIARKRALAQGLDPDLKALPVTTKRHGKTKAHPAVHQSLPPPSSIARMAEEGLEAMNELGDGFGSGAEAEAGGIPPEARLDEKTLARAQREMEELEAEEAVRIALGGGVKK